MTVLASHLTPPPKSRARKVKNVLATLLISLFLMLIPLPGPLMPLKPYWPALVLLYWCLQSGDRVTLGLAFCLGVAADLFDGVLLGEQALRLTAMVFIALRFR